MRNIRATYELKKKKTANSARLNHIVHIFRHRPYFQTPRANLRSYERRDRDTTERNLRKRQLINCYRKDIIRLTGQTVFLMIYR